MWFFPFAFSSFLFLGASLFGLVRGPVRVRQHPCEYLLQSIAEPSRPQKHATGYYDFHTSAKVIFFLSVCPLLGLLEENVLKFGTTPTWTRRKTLESC